MDGSKAPHTWRHRDPGAGTGPVPVEPYVSPDWFEAERERIFKRCWINVGRIDSIPRAGDFYVRDLHAARTQIIVVRGKDGKVRAFHNMCSHRGNPVTWEKSGNCRAGFACRFHGWTYDTQGRLVFVSDEASFFDLHRSQNGLTPVHCDVWQGFVFVSLAETPETSLANWMAPVDPTVAGYPFEVMRERYKYAPDETVNWKTACEAQQEGWHLPYLHSRTLAKSAITAGEQFRHSALIPYGPHAVVSSPPPKGYKPTPTAAVAGRYGLGTFDSFSADHSTDAATNKWHGAFDLYFIFPNFFIGLLQGTYLTYNFWPLAIDRTIWEITVYYPEARNAGQIFSQEYGKCGLRDTLMEDGFTHERVQSVIGSGAKTQFHLSDEEHVVRHFANTVRHYVTRD